MLTIHLHNLQFHSCHGMFKEERVLGNNFELNVAISFEEPDKITKLQESIDYVSIYNITKTVMDVPTQLLETVVQDLAEKYYSFDKKIKKVSISIQKLNPPIPNFQGTVGISYSKEF